MADVKIEIIKVNEYEVHVPEALKDSKVAEKFVTAYLENISKIKIEEKKIDHLKEQNGRKREEDAQTMFYAFLIIFFVAIALGVFCSIWGSIIVGLIGLGGMTFITYRKLQLE